MSLSGHCLCGSVHYRVDGLAKAVLNCHCEFCRRMTGAPLSSYVVVMDVELMVTKGAERLHAYAASGNATRHFCATCSTPLFNRNTLYPSLAMLYLGALDASGELPPTRNIFRENRLPWIDSIAGLKHFDREYVRAP